MKNNKKRHNIQHIDNGEYFNEEINNIEGENKFLKILPIRNNKNMQRTKNTYSKKRNNIKENC